MCSSSLGGVRTVVLTTTTTTTTQSSSSSIPEPYELPAANRDQRIVDLQIVYKLKDYFRNSHICVFNTFALHIGCRCQQSSSESVRCRRLSFDYVLSSSKFAIDSHDSAIVYIHRSSVGLIYLAFFQMKKKKLTTKNRISRLMVQQLLLLIQFPFL